MSPCRRFLILHLAFCGIIVQIPTATSAQGWSWPEEPENLKVLPDTISAESLSRIMRGFTAALGVRCEHCHVGEAGKPLSEFDFPADDKRNKRVARQMLEMVRTINEDVIAEIEEPTGLEVNCFTCHRGRPVPPQALHRLLSDTLDAAGTDETLRRYEALRSEFYGTGVYDFGPRTFTRIADRLLDDGRTDEAIVLLERGIAEHPDDALTRFYMGRAYLAKEDTILARIHLDDALVLDPDSRFIRRTLQSLLPSH